MIPIAHGYMNACLMLNFVRVDMLSFINSGSVDLSQPGWQKTEGKAELFPSRSLPQNQLSERLR